MDERPAEFAADLKTASGLLRNGTHQDIVDFANRNNGKKARQARDRFARPEASSDEQLQRQLQAAAAMAHVLPDTIRQLGKQCSCLGPGDLCGNCQQRLLLEQVLTGFNEAQSN